MMMLTLEEMENAEFRVKSCHKQFFQRKNMTPPKKAKKFRPNPEARLMDQGTEVLRYHHIKLALQVQNR